MTETPQTIVVVGMAGSGRAAAQLAVSQGYRVIGMDVRTDVEPLEGVELQLGPHDRDVLLSADQIVVSRGVPMEQPDLVAARESDVPMVGELGFAFSQLNIPVVAISGTNGKSTVTSFVGQLLTMAGKNVFVGGNIGTPLSEAVGKDYSVAVVEVSSYQLEMPGAFRPQVAAILNLTPDHLGRHGTMEAYANTKVALFRHMNGDGVVLLSATNKTLIEATAGVYNGPLMWLGARPGVTREGKRVLVDLGMQTWHFNLEGFTVPGQHNLDNVGTAAALCLAMGVDARTIQASLPKLEGLPHRMEVVSTQNNVVWINDSKATNVAAALVGLKGLDRVAVVLLGGQAKGPGFVELAPFIKEHRAVITFGGSGPDIAKELEESGVECIVEATMESAIERARALAKAGDTVLLSPGCASFDAYRDFEHRGDVFREWVAREGKV